MSSVEDANTGPAAVPASLTSYSQRVQFNGTIDFPSKYRGASPEVDEAWSELVDGE